MKKIIYPFLKEISLLTGQAIITFSAVGIAVILFFMLPKNAAEYLFEGQSHVGLRFLWFIVVIPVVFVFAWFFTSNVALEKAVKSNLIKANIPSYILVGFILFAISGVLFSTVVYLLAKSGLVSIVSIDGIHTITIASMIDLFMWHFLEAIPALHINDLLKFPRPYDFDGKIGALVLLFQLGVIFPIIGFHKKLREFKEKEKEKSNSSSSGE